MISAFVRCLSLGATQSARLADLDTYRAVSVPQMPHLWNDHRRTRQVTRSAGHGTLGWRKSTSERANGAFEAAKMISHRRFITTAVATAGTQLPASVRGLWSPFKNGGGGVGDGVCNVGSRGEGGMLPDSKQPTVRPESWRTTVTRTTFPKEP